MCPHCEIQMIKTEMEVHKDECATQSYGFSTMIYPGTNIRDQEVA